MTLTVIGRSTKRLELQPICSGYVNSKYTGKTRAGKRVRAGRRSALHHSNMAPVQPARAGLADEAAHDERSGQNILITGLRAGGFLNTTGRKKM